MKKQPSLLKLDGPAASAIQAVAAGYPSIARRLVSWTPSYAHALGALLQVRGTLEPRLARQLFDGDCLLQDAGTSELLRMSGFGRPDRLLPLLDRLGTRLHSLADYRKWEHLLIERRLAGFVRSSRKQLTAARLNALADLHPDLRSRRLMTQVQSTKDVAALNFAVSSVSRMCPHVTVADIRRSLRDTKSEIAEWLEGWFVRAALPEPPFPGNELLVPLRTGAQIKEVARTFRNCLLNSIEEAVFGRVAYYLWQEEPLLVAVRPLGRFAWVVDDIKGVENRNPPAATKRRIVAELVSWGCFKESKVEEGLHKWGIWNLI